MTFSLINQTANQLSYADGQIVVPASGQVNVQIGLMPYLALDPGFLSDITNIPANVVLSDGSRDYSGVIAYQYMQNWIIGTPPQNASDPVAFTLAGKGFSANASANINNTTETALLLLENPNNATVNARAMYFYAAPAATQGIVTINIYTNPTVSNNGTAITIQNNLVSSSSPASAMNAYALPTISNFGTKRLTMVVNANADSTLFDFAQTAIMTPGNSMLMTVSVSNLGLLTSVETYFYLQWVEV